MVRLPSGALKCRFNCKVDNECSKPRFDFDVECFPLKRTKSLDATYVVEKNVLGSGGFGIVRRATLRLGGGPVCAVKTIAKTGRAAVATARGEAQMLQGLSHPNICKLLDVCEDSQSIHLVLECVEGHELLEEISAQKLMTESRAACIMKQTFEALQYCHERDVIHRDVKAENIMVTDSRMETDAPHVHLIDFGLATTCCDVIHTPIVGTACYMAPEALRTGMYSSSADMWSAGVVLYALLTGDIPDQFQALDKSDCPQATTLQCLSTSRTSCDLLRALLRSQPSQRIAASAAARHPWTIASNHRSMPEVQVPVLEVQVPVVLSRILVDGYGVEKRTAAPREVTPEVDMLVAERFDDEFAVFVDSDKAEAVNGKQHLLQPSVGICAEIEQTKSRRYASASEYKENLGPGAPRVWKHVPGPAAFQGKCAKARGAAEQQGRPSRRIR